MEKKFEKFNKLTVDIMNYLYNCLKVNMFFIISNSLGIVTLIFLKPTFTNIFFFVFPLFLLFHSILMEFRVLANLEKYDFRYYIKDYWVTLKNNWTVISFITFTTFLVFIDLQISTTTKYSALLFVVLIITSMFIINSLLYLILIQTRKESHQLTLRSKVLSAVTISYRLPIKTVSNTTIFAVTFYLIKFVSGFLTMFISGFLVILIWKNMNKRFSLDLYFKQQLK